MRNPLKLIAKVSLAIIICFSCVSKKKYLAVESQVSRLKADSAVLADRVEKLEIALKKEKKKNPINKIKAPLKKVPGIKKKKNNPKEEIK